MKSTRSRTGAALLLGATVLLLPLPAAANSFFSLGEQYSGYKSNQSREKGSQFYTPVAASVGSEGGLFAGLASGYAVSTYRPPEPGAPDVTVSTMLDTKLSLFYTATLGGACVRVGSTFNLPTGMSALSAKQRPAEMDREFGDLVDVTNFGEGTNASPGLAVTLPLDAFTLGLGGSFHVKGAYDPTTDVANDDVDPGDEVLGKVSLRWSGGHTKISAGIKYQYIGADKVGGQMVYKEGNELSANAYLEYTPRPWFVFLEGAYNNREKGRNASGSGDLPVDEFARYGDDLYLKATVQYLATASLVLVVEGNGRWAQGNNYPHDSAFYDSGRSSWQAEAGFVYQVFPGIFVSGSVSYQQVREAVDATLVEDTTYNGLKGSLHVATIFK